MTTSTSSSSGTVVAVSRNTFGDELTTAANAGDLALVVDDVIDFSESGGTLRIGGDDANAQTVAYSAISDGTSTITLSAALAHAWPVGTRVDAFDPETGAAEVELRALVQLAGDVDNDDAIDATVAHALVPLLAEGIRDPGAGESVTLTRIGTEWSVTDIIGKQPAIDGSAIALGSIQPPQLGFTAGGVTATIALAPPASPTTGDLWFDSANGYTLHQYDGSTWQPYQYGTAALQDGAITAGKVSFSARDIGGVATTIGSLAPTTGKEGDLWYDSSQGYRMSRWTNGGWSIVQFGTSAIQAGAVTAALIAANTITAAQIAAGTITASQIAAGTITGDRLSAGTITGDLIAAGAIVAGSIAAGALDALTINAGAIVAGSFQGSIGASSVSNSTVSDSDVIVGPSAGRLLAYGAVVSTTVVLSTVGANSWVCPAGVTSVKVEAWGGGGAGGGAAKSLGAQYAAYAGGGGGGSEYARNDRVPVTPGASYAYTVGAGGVGAFGTGGAGAASTFTGDSATVVSAHGGKGGGGGTNSTSGNGGASGSGSTAPIHFNGGKGGAGDVYAGGGGSSGGSSSPGNNGGDDNGFGAGNGGGAAVADGGAGGDGSTNRAGGVPGGGGAGAAASSAGATLGAVGGRGQIRITYSTGAPTLLGSASPSAGVDQYGNAYPAGVRLFDTPQVVTDWNAATAPGHYYGASAANGPTVSRTYIGEVYVGPPGVDAALVQIIRRLSGGDTPEQWMRQRSAPGVWSAWHPVGGQASANGQVTVNSVTASVTYSAPIAFPVGLFTDATKIRVFVSAHTTGPETISGPTVADPTLTGTTVYVRRTGANQSTKVDWFAVQDWY